MLDWGHAEATDSRDKVYAFLSLAKDLNTIIPDYNALPQDVHTDLVRRYVEKDGNIEIICTHHRGRNSLTLPSWVPDWSIPQRRVHNWMIYSHNQSLFAAGYPNIERSKYSYALPSVEGISFEDGDALWVPGTFIGCISDIRDAINPHYSI